MFRPSAFVTVAAATITLAAPALALNPQPLPPRRAPVNSSFAPPKRPPIRRQRQECSPPMVLRHMKVHGHYVWRCIHLKIERAQP